jgi:hypothetical protein
VIVVQTMGSAAPRPSIAERAAILSLGHVLELPMGNPSAPAVHVVQQVHPMRHALGALLETAVLQLDTAEVIPAIVRRDASPHTEHVVRARDHPHPPPLHRPPVPPQHLAQSASMETAVPTPQFKLDVLEVPSGIAALASDSVAGTPVTARQDAKASSVPAVQASPLPPSRPQLPAPH